MAARYLFSAAMSVTCYWIRNGRLKCVQPGHSFKKASIITFITCHCTFNNWTKPFSSECPRNLISVTNISGVAILPLHSRIEFSMDQYIFYDLHCGNTSGFTKLFQT